MHCFCIVAIYSSNINDTVILIPAHNASRRHYYRTHTQKRHSTRPQQPISTGLIASNTT
jgi:hypothetical protein